MKSLFVLAMLATGLPASQVVADNSLSPPVAAVFSNYSRIQTALAKDSVDGVAKSAREIAKTVKEDGAKTFSATVAEQAEALGRTTDLAAARTAFKPLSQSLIDYASKNPPVSGLYRQVYCPMANASWLQTDSIVYNPYMGKSMPHCGEIVKWR
jgi:Cu(I)/Ag(I) efflux system membrane fusion protein